MDLGMKPVVKSMRLHGGKRMTTVQLEPEFWGQLKTAAEAEGMSVAKLVDRIRGENPESRNLASTLRVWCVQRLVAGGN